MITLRPEYYGAGWFGQTYNVRHGSTKFSGVLSARESILRISLVHPLTLRTQPSNQPTPRACSDICGHSGSKSRIPVEIGRSSLRDAPPQLSDVVCGLNVAYGEPGIRVQWIRTSGFIGGNQPCTFVLTSMDAPRTPSSILGPPVKSSRLPVKSCVTAPRSRSLRNACWGYGDGIRSAEPSSGAEQGSECVPAMCDDRASSGGDTDFT